MKFGYLFIHEEGFQQPHTKIISYKSIKNMAES